MSKLGNNSNKQITKGNEEIKNEVVCLGKQHISHSLKN